MKRFAFAILLVPFFAHANSADALLEALFGPAQGDAEVLDPEFAVDEELLDLRGEQSGTYAWTAEGELVFVPDQPRADEPQAACRSGLDERGRPRGKAQR